MQVPNQRLLRQLLRQLHRQQRHQDVKTTHHVFLLNNQRQTRDQKRNMKNMNYGKYEGFIHPDVIRALATREHELGNNPAYPPLENEDTEGNFEQQIAKKRFNDLVVKYQDATKTGNLSVEEFAKFVQTKIMFHVFMHTAESCTIEKPHRPMLEKLAVDIVRQDFNIGEKDIIFNVKLVGMGNVKFPDDMRGEKEDMAEPPDISEENFIYDVDDEVAKRRLINGLISGASKKGHYIFHLGKDKLDEINPKLIPLYQVLMSANDLTYFMLGEEFTAQATESESSHAGFERLSFADDGTPILTVEAVNFPTLLHEIIKGVVELIATLSLPDDKNMTEYLYDMSDHIEGEMWYLRLGAVLWERLIECLPVEYMSLKSQLLGKLFETETDDFNELMQSALSTDNQEGMKKFFSTWGRTIKENIRDYNQRNT